MCSVMVINMGLKSIRCIIFDSKGRKLSSAALAINTAINDKCVEQVPEEWCKKAELVMKKAFHDSKRDRIDYITVTASASCLVCVDREGLPLGSALMISDKRAEKETEFVRSMPEFQEVYKRTGLDAAVSLMLPKILWMKRNNPGLFEKAAYFLTPNDYLISILSGRYVTDYLNAVKYHYDTERKEYPVTLLERLGIPLSSLPEVLDIGSKAGTLKSSLAERLGINADAEVIVTSYDAICSFIGSGVSEEGEASDVSGTVTVFRTLSRKKNIKDSTKIYRVPFCQEHASIVGGSNNLGGGLIEWVKQCYYQKEEYPYEIMEKEAGESDIGARGLVFLPYLLGERAPLWDDNARGVFFGLERMHTRKDMTRAVFESTGFIDLDIIEATREAGVDVQSIRLSGGLTRVNLISQIKADILNREIMVMSEFETTASGAAMLALIGQGIYGDIKQAAQRFARIRMIIKPNQESHEKYLHMYHLYKDTYQTVKDLYVRRIHALEQIRDSRAVQIENL